MCMQFRKKYLNVPVSFNSGEKACLTQVYHIKMNHSKDKYSLIIRANSAETKSCMIMVSNHFNVLLIFKSIFSKNIDL